MSHIPNELDIKTDLRRSVMASYSPKKFSDSNVITFVANAEKNLELVKDKIGEKKYIEVKEIIKKSNNTASPIEKRREDLLTAYSLI